MAVAGVSVMGMDAVITAVASTAVAFTAGVPMDMDMRPIVTHTDMGADILAMAITAGS
jgi:hypothetical protein